MLNKGTQGDGEKKFIKKTYFKTTLHAVSAWAGDRVPHGSRQRRSLARVSRTLRSGESGEIHMCTYVCRAL